MINFAAQQPYATTLQTGAGIPAYGPAAQTVNLGTGKYDLSGNAGRQLTVDDKDVRHLEARIDGVARETQLRTDAVLARIEGKFDTLTAKFETISKGLEESRSSTRTWGQWTVATVLAVGLALGGVLVGLKQVWIGGVQVGQAYGAAASPQAKSP